MAIQYPEGDMRIDGIGASGFLNALAQQQRQVGVVANAVFFGEGSGVLLPKEEEIDPVILLLCDEEL